MKKNLFKTQKAKTIGVCATALLLIGGGAVGVVQEQQQPHANWTADGVWHDVSENKWSNVHPRLTVSTGATNEQVLQAYLAKFGALPTAKGNNGQSGIVSYEFGDPDGNGKLTALQFYVTINGIKFTGPRTTLERQPQRPTVNTPAEMVLTTSVGHPLTEQQVLAGITAHSNNGNDTEENLQIFVQDLNTVNWNVAGYYTVHIEAKDRYNAPTVIVRTIHVEGNNGDNVTPPDQNKPVTPVDPGQPVTPPNNNQPNKPDKPDKPVTPSNPGHDSDNSNSGTDQDHNGNTPSVNPGIAIHDVITVTNPQGAPVYAINGNSVQNTGRVLAPNSPWTTGQKKTIDGTTYYQVSTNEWIKENDGKLNDNSNNNNDNIIYTRMISKVNKNEGAVLYNGHGSNAKPSGSILSKNTRWQVSAIVHDNGFDWYLVAKDGWIKSNESYLEETGVTYITNPKGAILYEGYGYNAKPTQRILEYGSPWKVNEIQTIAGTSWYLVAKNGWINSESSQLR